MFIFNIHNRSKHFIELKYFLCIKFVRVKFLDFFKLTQKMSFF